MARALNITITGDVKGFTSATKTAEQDVQRLEGTISKSSSSIASKIGALGKAAAVGFGAGVGALAIVGKEAFGLASDLEQATGGTAAVFKDQAGAIGEFAKSADQAVGLSESAARTLTSQLGGALKGYGFSLDEAAGKSKDLVSLGADLAATFGGSTEDAVVALSAALRGETDPLERYAIALNQNLVNEKAVAMGLASSTSEVSQHAKAQATLALIMERSTDAQGQFAREADTAAGAQARASAKWDNALALLGQNLLPVVSNVTNWFAERIPDAIKTVQGAIDGLRPVLDWLGGAWSSIAEAFQQGGLGQAFDVFEERLSEVWGRIQPLLGDLLSNIGNYIRDHWQEIGEAWTKLQSLAYRWIADAIPPILSWLNQLAQSIGNWIATTGFPWLAAKFEELKPVVLQWLANTASEIPGKAMELIAAINSWFYGTALPWLAQKGLEFAQAIGKWALEAASQIPGQLAEITGAILGWVGRQIADLPGHVAGITTAFLSWVGNAIVDLPGKLAELGQKFIDFAKEIPGKIVEGIGNLTTLLLDKGKDLMRGLFQGIVEIVQKLPDFLGPIKDKFIEAFKNAFESHSPARVMIPLGEAIAQGIVVGIDQGMPTVEARIGAVSAAYGGGGSSVGYNINYEALAERARQEYYANGTQTINLVVDGQILATTTARAASQQASTWG